MSVSNFVDRPTFSSIHLAQRLTAFAKVGYVMSLYPSEAFDDNGIENNGRS